MDESNRQHIKKFSVAVGDKGERITLNFLDGKFYTQEASVHEVCKGRVTFHPVSDSWAVLRCATCNLRVYIPANKLSKDYLSEVYLLAWFESQAEEPCVQVPCRACETIDDNFCYACNKLPPKDKRSDT